MYIVESLVESEIVVNIELNENQKEKEKENAMCVEIKNLKTEKVIKLNKLLKMESVPGGTSADDGSLRLCIGLDTQASGSVTNVRELIGELDYNESYVIEGWSGNTSTKYYGGYNNILGKMIYSDEATSTIYSYGDLLMKFGVEWMDNGSRCVATSRVDPSITLDFVLHSQDNENVLVADATEYHDKLLVSSSVKVCEMDVAEVLGGDNPITRRDFDKAKEVLRFHEFVHPGDGGMLSFAKSNCLYGIPFVTGDVKTAIKIRNGDCPACKMAKAVRRSRGQRRERKQKREIEALDDYVADPDVSGPLAHETLGFDCLFIDGNRYLLGVGKIGGLKSIAALSDGTKKSIGNAMVTFVDGYKRNRIQVLEAFNAHNNQALDADSPDVLPDLVVGSITSDGEQAIINNGLERLTSLGISTLPVAAGEHVGYVERAIRTIKERVAAIRSSLPYALDKRMLDWLLIYVVNWLNLLPSTGRSISAFTRHTRRRLNYTELTKAKYGDFVVAVRTEKQSAANGQRGEIGVCLGPVLTTPGSIYFLSLDTKAIKTRHRFEILHGIDGVAIFGENKHMAPPAMYIKNIGSYNDHYATVREDILPAGNSEYSPIDVDAPSPVVRIRIDNDEEVVDPVSRYISEPLEEIVQPKGTSTANPHLPIATPGKVGKGLGGESNSAAKNLNKIFDLVDEPAPGAASPVKDKDLSVYDPQPIILTPDRTGVLITDKSPEVSVKVEPVEIKVEPAPVVRRSTRNSSKVVNYREMAGLKPNVISVNSINFKKGVETYGDKAREAIMKEIKQIVVEYDVIAPSKYDYSEVSYMRTHDLIDEKLDGTIKARYVVGKPVKEGDEIDWGIDTYSPTIDMKLIFLMFSLCIEYDLDLEVWDIKGAFLKAEMVKKGIFAKVQPFIAKMMVELKPEWSRYLKKDGSLLVELKKAWYGTNAAPALWHQEISATLINECEYTRHPLVPCLFQKCVAESKCFLLLHVDDIGAMFPKDHVERDRVQSILEQKYEAMKIQRGDNVVYVGLECTRFKSHFEIRMTKRIQKLANKYQVTSGKKYPCSTSYMDKDTSKDELFKDVKEYRSLVQSVKWISTCTKPELLFICSYLACNQNEPSVSDYSCALHVLAYIVETKDMAMHIYGFGKKPVIMVYSDASFMVHKNGCSHGGTAVYVGSSRGAVFCTSGKIRCNCSSSTDAELYELRDGTYIGDYFRRVLLDIGIDCPVLYMQDNESAITLACSGTHAYDRKRRAMTNCINDIHDYLVGEDGKVSIVSISTHYMDADILTKVMFSDMFVRCRDCLHGLRLNTYTEALGGVLISHGLPGVSGRSDNSSVRDQSGNLPIRIDRFEPPGSE